MGEPRDPEEIVEDWGIDLENVGKEDLGFSDIDDPYQELYEVEGISEEEYLAASTVVAFLKYVEEIDENPSEDKAARVKSAIRSIDRFRERRVVKSSPRFLYDSDYNQNIQRVLQDRNMNKQITSSQLEEDKDPTVRDDFSNIEKRIINFLIGEEYEE